MGQFQGTERFAIKRRIGSGGMGVVYEAFDRLHGTPIALKTLRHLDAQHLYLFKTEFRALQGLNHTNLVTLGELIEEHGEWFFTMELVNGVDVLSHVRSVGRADAVADDDISPSEDTLRSERAGRSVLTRVLDDDVELRSTFGQLSLGLYALHCAGKVHRDIKPSNILVTSEGRVVVLDFGLIVDSSPTAQLEDPGVAGTIEYMAPEQAASKPVGPAADWYSMGVVLYEAMTGRLPFEGSTYEVLIDKQLHEPPPPRTHWPEVPRDLDSLCVDLLGFDPASRPSGEAVLKRLGVDEASKRSTVAVTSQLTQTAPFVGRDEELRELERAYAAVRGGDTVTVCVQGESGMGKSALIRHFTGHQLAKHSDLVVLAGRCYERESVPYKACDGLVDSLTRYLKGMSKSDSAGLLPENAAALAQIFPVLGRVEAVAQAPQPRIAVRDPHELRRIGFSALRELLRSLAESRSVIAVIDDLQWADADSLSLLRELLSPPNAPRLLLLVSLRSEQLRNDYDSVANHLDLAGDVRALPLLALEPQSSRKLARLLLDQANLLGDVSPTAIAVEARGHPMYLAELVRYSEFVGREGARRVRLDEAIWMRASHLGPATTKTLELIAVAGAPLPQETIREAAEIERPQFARCLSVLRAANLIRGAGVRDSDTAEPYHDRVREAVLDRLDDSARAKHHLRLAIALESSGIADQRPEMLLRHLNAAGETKKAARYAEEAADRAATALAFDQAAELYSTAMSLQDPDSEGRQSLRMQMARALAAAGRGFEAAEAMLEEIDDADPATRLECQSRAAEQFIISGHIEPGIEQLNQVLMDVGIRLPSTPRRRLVSLVWQRLKLRLRGLRWAETHASEIPAQRLREIDAYQAAATGLSMVDTVRGADFQTRCLLLALRAGEPSRVARALIVEATYAAARGGHGVPRAWKLIDIARGSVKNSGDPYLRGLLDGAEGLVHYFGGELKKSLGSLQLAERTLREQTTGYWGEVNVLRSSQVFVLRHIGAVRDLANHLDRYIRDAERRGDRYALATFARNRVLVSLALDDTDQARRDLSTSNWSPPRDGYHLQHYLRLWAAGEADLYEGNTVGVLDGHREAFRALASSLLLKVAQITRSEAEFLHGRLALAQAGSGRDGSRLRREAARCAARLEREGAAYASVWASVLRAGCAYHRDQISAAHLLEQAVDCAESHDMLLCAAAARRRWGMLVGGEQGKTLVAEADGWMISEGIKRPERMTRVYAPGFD